MCHNPRRHHLSFAAKSHRPLEERLATTPPFIQAWLMLTYLCLWTCLNMFSCTEQRSHSPLKDDSTPCEVR